MMDTKFLDDFEHTLQDGLLKVCNGAGLLQDGILESEDLENKWNDYLQDYVADAVANFNDWPQSAVAWAGFLGMAVAHHWDADWPIFKDDSYASYYGKRGFDDMDEHILGDILKLSSQEASKYSNLLSSCAMAALGLIRHEGIEAQTDTGFYVLVRTYTVLFRIGAALELSRLGYKKVFA